MAHSREVIVDREKTRREGRLPRQKILFFILNKPTHRQYETGIFLLDTEQAHKKLLKDRPPGSKCPNYDIKDC